MYCINPGVPTSYPTDAMQCCIDCANGICNEAPDVKLWAHYVAISYAAAQALAAPCPCPGPCSIAEFEAMHKAMKSIPKMAAPFNWLALIQLLVAAAPAILQALLALLGLPTPPAPAKKP